MVSQQRERTTSEWIPSAERRRVQWVRVACWVACYGRFISLRRHGAAPHVVVALGARRVRDGHVGAALGNPVRDDRIAQLCTRGLERWIREDDDGKRVSTGFGSLGG